MRDDASRARAASEEHPIVAWLVQEAGRRPCRRREPSRVAVGLEPREGSGEDRECGGECRAHDQTDDQPLGVSSLAEVLDPWSQPPSAEARALNEPELLPVSGG